jgi:formyltetrahydrofolate deformylase
MGTKEVTHIYDLLMKQRTGELDCEIPLVVSNREDLKWVAEQFDVPFFYLPLDKTKPRDQEKKVEALLEKHQIDLTILARYMRILSADFVNAWAGKMINIHHSFLPAFKGAKPYHQAWERGVKMIGATAHYVSPDLDEGPIIAQEALPVSHHYSVKELIRAGRELERLVLAKAVRAHLEHRVVLWGKRTIVFNF